MARPERIIKQRLDTAEILRSPTLIGCYGLKPVPQTKPFTCGAAAAATVLRYFGKESNEYQCTEALKPSPVVGITWFPIVKYLRKRGLKARGWAHYTTDRLIENARRGIPTLVEWLDWGGHWVVSVGYDRVSDALVFADPAKPRSNFTCFSTDDFRRYWIAGGTGSMQQIPALAIEISSEKTVDDDSYEYAETKDYKHYLYDWRTRKVFCAGREYAYA